MTEPSKCRFCSQKSWPTCYFALSPINSSEMEVREFGYCLSYLHLALDGEDREMIDKIADALCEDVTDRELRRRNGETTVVSRKEAISD